MQVDQTFADTMVEQAIANCAERYFAGDTRKVRKALLHGECEHCKCISDDLARQIGEYLGQVDGTITAVYQYEPAASVPESETPSGIHFLVWVDHKSAALNALAETLESVLAESQRKLGCPNARSECYTLDMEMVDDRDVRKRRGFGLFVNNPSLRAQLIWSRTPQPKPAPAAPEPTRGPYQLPEWFDPEFIPEARLIDHALTIERLPPQDRVPLEHHLIELKVTLIRRIISDQLRYINIAREWFTVADLKDIYQRRIGFGRIGGKSAGMLLAGRILNEVGGEALKACIRIPESYFLGSDLMYIFMSMNGLMHWNNQKYKPEDQIRAEYPKIQKEFAAGKFPPEILVELQTMLDRIGSCPIIVRSSSQLEDNLGTSFAGKYDSHFCPNQGTAEENLQALTQAIASTYASTFKPDALLYRRSRGLQDYDERMAVLIQPVEGEKVGHYYLPFGAGVAFSHNLYRWDPQIRREAGFVRLVWGLGTRAVDRVGNDFPRLVALSHPLLQPDDSPEAIRHYSQHFVDLIDLESNLLTTMPVGDILKSSYPPIRYLVQIEQDGYFSTPPRRIFEEEIPRAAITFNALLRKTQFPTLLSGILRLLEEHYHNAVDIEFTVHIPDSNADGPKVEISLLQCRPQSQLQESKSIPRPKDLPADRIIFSSNFVVPEGYLPNIRFVIFVDPEAYFALPTIAARNEIGRIVSRLNSMLAEKSFMCVGPGRWGTENTDLGVYVGYSDICNAGALVELAGRGVGAPPEPSLGTHFFQDLMEAQIYPVAVPIDQKGTIFNRDFFYNTPNKLPGLVEVSDSIAACLRLIDVAAFRPGHHLELIMDGEKGEAVAFLTQ
jgi:hypothetical protein